jgi:hypothetical protein
MVEYKADLSKPYSGFSFTNAVQNCACSRCGAEPKESCCRPNGRKANVPHMERIYALKQQYPDIFSLSTRPFVEKIPCQVDGQAAFIVVTQTGYSFIEYNGKYFKYFKKDE